MDDAVKLLRNWRKNAPSGGVKCEDALKVMRFLGMDVEGNGKGHYHASHNALMNSPLFMFGGFTISCHAFGTQGQAHPSAIKDILKAATIIQAAREEE